MKHSRADVCGKARLGLDIRFEAQNLTSYSGLRAGPRGLDRDRDLLSGIF